jgi:D-arabinose 1-dehydrogenase-like Zn-dependent alcohol dehydrogenase
VSPSSMRAVQAIGAGQPYEVAEVPVHEPGPGQVRVRVRACGVCGGDEMTRFGLLGVQFPRIPGHEIAGEIDAVGPGVTRWQPGQRVGVGFHGGSCLTCEFCRNYDFANCVTMTFVGLSFDGGFAEYLVAPQDAVAQIPDGLSFVEAAPLMCAGVTTFVALRDSAARPGDTVAIHGLGGLGHLGLQFADKFGFRVVAISRGREKEGAARRLGADEFIDSEEGSAGAALAHLGGASVAVSTVPHGPAQADLVQGLRRNGQLVILAPAEKPVEVSTIPLIAYRQSVIGANSGWAKDAEDAMAFAVLKDVRATVETHPLEEAENAFQNMSRARYRSVLVP